MRIVWSVQLFYLVTDLYKEGNGKEMRKWAYEIHSSFLGPGAVGWFVLQHRFDDDKP